MFATRAWNEDLLEKLISRSANQEILHLECDRNFFYRVHSSSTLNPILRELSAVFYNRMFSNVNAVWILGASSPVRASENVEPNRTFHLSTIHLLISYFTN
jgi:hypothetical protein